MFFFSSSFFFFYSSCNKIPTLSDTLYESCMKIVRTPLHRFVFIFIRLWCRGCWLFAVFSILLSVFRATHTHRTFAANTREILRTHARPTALDVDVIYLSATSFSRIIANTQQTHRLHFCKQNCAFGWLCVLLDFMVYVFSIECFFLDILSLFCCYLVQPMDFNVSPFFTFLYKCVCKVYKNP